MTMSYIYNCGECRFGPERHVHYCCRNCNLNPGRIITDEEYMEVGCGCLLVVAFIVIGIILLTFFM